MTSEEGMELWCMGYEGTDFCVDEDGYYECLLSADEVEDKNCISGGCLSILRGNEARLKMRQSLL